MRATATTALAALTLCLGASCAGPGWAGAAARPSHRAAGPTAAVSRETQRFAAWVIASGDSHAMPFVVIDKKNAAISVYYPDGRLRGGGPALLGLAKGDDSVPGIGQRKLSTIRPEERTTPAGRFVGSLGNDLGARNVVWVDYDAGISLHRVVTSNPRERRLQRLATASTRDKRISYGCINVPAAFYDRVVEPSFTGTSGVIYILPEIRSLQAVFPGYDTDKAGN
jgi:hypothetical protein